MKTPFDKNSSRFVDERQNSMEYSKYFEVQKAKENPSSAELFRAEELPMQKAPVPVPPKNKDNSLNLRVLTASNFGLATVAVTVAVTTVAILPAKNPAPAPSPPASSSVIEPPPIILPTFEMREPNIGLDAFQGELIIENADGLTLIATLTDANGNRISQSPVESNAKLSYNNLETESVYTLSVQDQEGKERYTYSFTTEPYVTLVNLEDGTGAKLLLHSSVSMDLDGNFSLYDAEGKDFSSNVYYQPIDGGSDSSDSVTMENVEYILTFDGLFMGEYTLQFTNYLPDDQVIAYKKKISLGTLEPLVYTATVEKEVAQITLQYVSGDLGGYTIFQAELYQNGEYVTVAEVMAFGDNVLTVPIDPSWQSGEYTLYLMGELDGWLYNQVVKIEIIL